MHYKLLVCDVDGTLVSIDRKALPSEKVKTAIAEAQKHVHVGVATGRAAFLVKPVLEALNITGPCVVEDGTQIIEGKSGKVLWEQRIDPTSYHQVLEIVHRLPYPTTVSTGLEHVLYQPDRHVPDPLDLFIDEIPPEVVDDILKQLATITTIHTNKFISWKKGHVGITISHLKANKHYGLVKLAEILNIHTREIMAIGDGYNDFPLMMASGFKVAMGNAVDDLKAIADYVAPSVTEDGVADAINKFILHKS